MGKTLWVSAAGTGLATVYSGGAGTVKQEKTQVRVPGGRPTGQVVNSGEEFVVKGPGGSGPATFIFASPSGAITGWNAEADPDDAVISAFVKGADLKGLALAQTNRGPMLLAADFANNRVHVFDGDFDRLQMGRNAFRDPGMPADYAPFNVEVVGRSILVAYAKRDPQTGKAVAGKGKGFISHFDGSGRFVDRFAARGALNAPWAMTLAPRASAPSREPCWSATSATAGSTPTTRATAARSARCAPPTASPSPWRTVGPGAGHRGGGRRDALWFSAGSDGGTHGVLGVIRPAGASRLPPCTSVRPATPAPSASHPSSHSNSNSGSGYDSGSGYSRLGGADTPPGRRGAASAGWGAGPTVSAGTLYASYGPRSPPAVITRARGPSTPAQVLPEPGSRGRAMGNPIREIARF